MLCVYNYSVLLTQYDASFCSVQPGLPDEVNEVPPIGRTLQVAKEDRHTMLQLNKTRVTSVSKPGWQQGVVKVALAEKQMGFITPCQETNQGGLPQQAGGRSEEDVFFHFSNASSHGLQLRKGDTVEFKLFRNDRDKSNSNKKKSASKVKLLKIVRRQHIVYRCWVEETVALVKGKGGLDLLERTDGYHIWRRILSLPFTTTEWTDEIMSLFLALSEYYGSQAQCYFNLVKVAARTKFFAPQLGSHLFDYVHLESQPGNTPPDMELLRKFLLALVIPDNGTIRALFPFLQALGEVAEGRFPHFDKCLLEFLRCSAAVSQSANAKLLEWNELPLAPTQEELCGSRPEEEEVDEEWSPVHKKPLPLPVVHKTGAYQSLDQYLDTYFRLLREDCFSKLKEGVQQLLHKRLDIRDMNVYVDIQLVGIEAVEGNLHADANSGISFGLRIKSVKPHIKWEQSRDLMFGNLLCISTDGTFNKPLWATVSSRDLLAKNGIVLVDPCLELNGSDLASFISSLKFASRHTTVAVESPAYYKAFQPVLQCLQMPRTASMPFQEELVSCDLSGVHPPFYLDAEGETTIDVMCLLKLEKTTERKPKPKPVVLPLSYALDWLRDTADDLCVDKAQRTAICHALTNRVTIIQGPPGTGKTYIGVKLVQLLLSSSTLPANSPILVLTYKNHALDEFLVECKKFISVVRVGGRSEDERLAGCNARERISHRNRSQSYFDAREDAMESLRGLNSAARQLSVATRFSVNCFLDYSSPVQVMNLLLGVPRMKWGYGDYSLLCHHLPSGNLDSWLSETNRDVLTHLVQYALRLWLPPPAMFTALRESAVRAQATRETVQIPEELLKAAHAASEEDSLLDKEDIDELERVRMAAYGGATRRKGEVKLVYLGEEGGKQSRWPAEIPGLKHQAQAIASQLENHSSDPWRLNAMDRALLVQHLIAKRVENCQLQLLHCVQDYNSACRLLSEVSTMDTAKQLSSSSCLLGMTITGAAMNHKLLSALRPPIVIVEEAAEVLEPQIVAALGPWVKHLIMIGDHKQLRPPVETYQLCKHHGFDISMMERLMDNHLPHGVLVTQNRMRPEFSQLLLDIYPQLLDNMDVVGAREAPRCMEHSMFFWHHDGQETSERSFKNEEEVVRVTQLALWFIQQGYRPDQVTILTPYQGQTHEVRKSIRANISKVFRLEDHPDLLAESVAAAADTEASKGTPVPAPKTHQHHVLVHTIDRYQGDENDIVIVSLTRSNQKGQTGFLKLLNRRCVAQSRARCGLYFVGNVPTLQHSDHWSRLMANMKQQERLGPTLALVCQRHPENKVFATHANDIPINKTGFCTVPCGESLPCGLHSCKKPCQPWHPHKVCRQRVRITLQRCGHSATRDCGQTDDSVLCMEVVQFLCHGEACTRDYERQCHDESGESPISAKCTEMVTVTLSCGHPVTKPCNLEKERTRCKVPCPLKLPECGHQCSAKCGMPCNSVPCKVCQAIEKQQQEEKREAIRMLIEKLQQERDMELERAASDDVPDGSERKPDDAKKRDIQQRSVDLLEKRLDATRQPQIEDITEIYNTRLIVEQNLCRLRLHGVREDSQLLPFNAEVGKTVPAMVQDGFRHQATVKARLTHWRLPSLESVDLSEASATCANYLVWCEVYLGRTQTFPVLPDLKQIDRRDYDSCYIQSSPGQGQHSSAAGQYCVFDHRQVLPKYIVTYNCKPLLSVLGTNLEKEAIQKNEMCHMVAVPSRYSADDPDERYIISTAGSAFFRRKNTSKEMVITKVMYYVQPQLVERFATFRTNLGKRYPGGKQKKLRKPVWAFHATDANNVISIMTNNFDISRVGVATHYGGKFGSGIYLSEYPDYSLRYGGPNKALLLCYVLPGKEYECTEVKEGRGLEDGFDSHRWCADEEGYGKELCFFDPDQILPVMHIEVESKDGGPTASPSLRPAGAPPSAAHASGSAGVGAGSRAQGHHQPSHRGGRGGRGGHQRGNRRRGRGP